MLRSTIIAGASLCCCCLTLTGCELESGECTDAKDISVQFKIVATFLDAAGKQAANTPAYIRSRKDLCDGKQKFVVPLEGSTTPAGQLAVTHGYNLRAAEDRVTLTAGFKDGASAERTFTYDQLGSSKTLDVALTVRAQ